MEKKDFFTLKVVTPEKIEFLSKEIKFVKVRTIRGDIGILPNHTNFMSSLGEGLMLIKSLEEEKNLLY
ncbi:Na(+)-translocating ATPase subunit epsilon [Streptobacillus moniliformis]|nr:Na(+)-translocating ATPase subunit epsilon [Streptobacillus moniliformis]